MFDSIKPLPKYIEKLYHAPIWVCNDIRRELNSISRKKQLLMKTIIFNLAEKSHLTRFYNIHEGKSCWIIGNGPSLNNTNLMALKDQFTFVVNGITLHEKFEDLKPTYYAATNPRLMQSEFLKYDVMPKLAKTGTICFLNIESKKRIGHFYENVCYILSTEFPLIIEKGYNLDITKLLLGTRVSVIIQAVIPIAIYMGFKTIYLVGCDSDYHNFIPGRTHFYKEDVPPKLTKLMDYVHNLYAERYKNPVQSMRKYHSDNINEWEIVCRYMERLGVKIYNCTVGGLLEVFPRCCLEDVLKFGSNI